jgi:hypothetical protein
VVYIVDEGSAFDMPLETLWEFLPSEAHKHSAKLIGRELQGNVLTVTSERNVDGKTVRSKLRMTMYPPLGVVQEHLEGPTAGSKAFIYYAPKGSKTAITVVGDFKIAGVSDEEGTKKAVMQMLERSFDEDVATFKSMK